ncbi:MAG: hypothetical protein KTR26_02110 [Flammeovirgaceae bacterium]|nr:hypothetical protein [Flammeovirgaceae bacterium]
MWFGTENGLNKYDGYQFTIYTNEPSDSTSISSNRINDILKDKDGDLWIATANGLNLYNEEFDNFRPFFKQENTENSLKDNEITCLFQDSNSLIYIGTYKGFLHVYDKTKNQFKPFPSGGNNEILKLSKSSIRSILEDHTGNLFIGTSLDGIWHYDYQLKKAFPLRISVNNQNGEAKNIQKIKSLTLDNNGNLWIGTIDNGVVVYNLDTKNIRHFTKENSGLKSNFIVSSQKDYKNNIWIGTDGGGICKFDNSSSEIECFKYDPGNLYSINHNVVRTIYPDDFGNIWIGTYAGGVNLIKVTYKEFGPVDLRRFTTDELIYQSCLSFFDRENGNFWVGTDGGGIIETDFNFKPLKFIIKNDNKVKGISNNAIICMYEDDKYLWAGTFLGGLNRVNLSTGNIEWFSHNKEKPGSISHNIVWDIVRDKKNNLWIGTESGLNLYDPLTESFKAYYLESNSALSVTVIHPEASGNLWLGTRNGFYYYNQKDFLKYAPPNLQGNDFHILSVHQDTVGNFWLGTNNNGLFKFNPLTKKFKAFSIKDGLPNNIITGIEEDQKHNLWISTGNGLSKFNPKYNTFQNYFIQDGLQGNQFNFGAHLKTRSGKLLFGGINGFNAFYPDSISFNPNPPKITLTGFKIFNEEIDQLEDPSTIYTQNITVVDTFNLNYDHSVITFNYSALDYSNPDLISYAYRLVGFDKDWQYVGNRRSATYTNLPPRTYTFKIKAANNDGIWDKTGKSFVVIVKPPLWETIWFRIGGLVIIILFLLWGIHRKTNIMLRRQNELEQKVNKRTIEVTQQKDEISKQNEILHENKEQLHNQYLELQSTLEKLKTAQSQIVQSEKLASLGVITAGIAHEINNPVNYVNNGIVGLKKVLNKIIEVSERYEEVNVDNFETQLEEIQQFKQKIKFTLMLKMALDVADNIALGGKKTAEIIKSLSTFSHSKDAEFRRENLHKGIDSTLLLLNNEYKSRININKKYGEIPEIECNLGRLGQVFMNLISNAIHSIEKEGEITISTTSYNGQVEVGIKDNGCGIPQQVKEKIFEPFFTTKDIGQGMGLGLSITLNIIKEHNGEIEVFSKENEGTHFLIKLPLKQS